MRHQEVLKFFRDLRNQHLGLIAGGVTFYIVLSLPPLLFSFYILASSLGDSIGSASLKGFDNIPLPDTILQYLNLIFAKVKEASPPNIYWLIPTSFAAMWSSTIGTTSLIRYLNSLFTDSGGDQGFFRALESKGSLSRWKIKLKLLPRLIGLLILFLLILSLNPFVHFSAIVTNQIKMGWVANATVSVFEMVMITLLFFLAYKSLYRMAGYKIAIGFKLTRGIFFAGILSTLVLNSYSVSLGWIYKYSSIGALGSTFTTMLWIYATTVVFLTGAHFDEWAKTKGQ